jgi:hypothetical protein
MDGASMARNWHFRRWTDPPLKRRSPALVGTSNRAGFIGIGSGQTHIVTARGMQRAFAHAMVLPFGHRQSGSATAGIP